MDPAVQGDDYAIESFHVTDGDTLRAHLRGYENVVADDRYLVPGWSSTLSVARSTRRDLPGVLGQFGPPIRLATLNTPERNRAGWAEATAMLHNWLTDKHRRYGLRVEVWPEEGAFGRMLGDVYVDGDRADTASQYMLQMGWDPYLPNRKPAAQIPGQLGFDTPT